MQKHSIYYAPKTIMAFNAYTDPVSSIKGTIYFGIQAPDLLLKHDLFYHSCGFLLFSKISDLVPLNGPLPTTFIVSSIYEAERLRIVKELTFALIPLEPTKTLHPYNDRYKTEIPFALMQPPSGFVELLQDALFTFHSKGKSFVYRVETGSIQEKRQKKSVPICSIYNSF